MTVLYQNIPKVFSLVSEILILVASISLCLILAYFVLKFITWVWDGIEEEKE